MQTMLGDEARVAQEAGQTAGAAGEFRRGADRRRRPTPMFSRYVLWGGRRRHVRRTEEREGAFVDVHSAGVFVIVVGIVALNLLDAWFTLLFLSHGGQELNPIVQWLLESEWHPWPFVGMKTLGIGIACMFLAMARNFQAARLGLWTVFLGYTCLLGWHLYLLASLADAE
ncbi:MAG: hypothetical protein INH34_11770 [Phycisphaerales bacterium]|nr:hypothetical protein [Phycisphaerales bacterium]